MMTGVLLAATACAFVGAPAGYVTPSAPQWPRTLCRMPTRSLSMQQPPPPPPPPPTARRRDSGDDGESPLDIMWAFIARAARAAADVAMKRRRELLRALPLLPVVGYATYRPFRRAIRTQRSIVPILVRLHLFERRAFEDEATRLAARDALDDVLSTDFADFIGRMRGAFVKVAQVLGSFEPAPVRPAYVKKLEPMVDAAPGGRPWRRVRRQLNRELKRAGAGSIDEVFSEFDREPIGTASVGQVHRAVLRSSGRVVAVKLQYPDARSLILSDLGNIHRVLKTLRKEAEAGVVVEYRKRMSMEFDYVTEARTMNAVAEFFEGGPALRTGITSRVAVPKCLVELSTRKLLVMDFIEGGSLRDSLRAKVAAAERHSIVFRLPMLLRVQHLAKTQLRTLLDAQAQQIFRLGTFNADPHPGNVILRPHGRGIGLLDFGCSKTLSPAQRASLARLYVALSTKDEAAIASAAVEMGMRTRHMGSAASNHVLVSFATHFFDRDLTTMSPPAYLLSLKAIEPITALPNEYMMVARSSLLLRGLGAKVRAPQKVSQVWASEARRYLKAYEASEGMA